MSVEPEVVKVQEPAAPATRQVVPVTSAHESTLLDAVQHLFVTTSEDDAAVPWPEQLFISDGFELM